LQSSPPPKSVGHIVAKPLIKHDDSLSSDESSLLDDTVRTLPKTATAIAGLIQPLYHDDADESKILRYFIRFSPFLSTS
jgi:hypothetical protein